MAGIIVILIMMYVGVCRGHPLDSQPAVLQTKYQAFANVSPYNQDSPTVIRRLDNGIANHRNIFKVPTRVKRHSHVAEDKATSDKIQHELDHILDQYREGHHVSSSTVTQLMTDIRHSLASGDLTSGELHHFMDKLQEVMKLSSHHATSYSSSESSFWFG